MRMIMGLDRPDAGQVRIGGKSYGDLRWPLREVGALLEAKAFLPGRTARAHLTALAASNAIGQRAAVVDAVVPRAACPDRVAPGVKGLRAELLQQLPGHHCALDLVGALVDLRNRRAAASFRR
jgi:ABC-type multidrug transport system ATPase subunit